jgi:hypothetical protein
MGASNVQAVYTYWGDLPDVAFRLLTYMALRSLDADDPPEFWEGREHLVNATGRPMRRGPKDAGKTPELLGRLDYESVRAAIAQLIAAGAISRVRKGAPGRTARYALHLLRVPAMGQTKPASVPSPTQTKPASMGQTKPANGPDETCVMGQTKPGAEEEGGVEDYREEEIALGAQLTSSPRDVARERVNMIFGRAS